jgi:hypothetical protein
MPRPRGESQRTTFTPTNELSGDFVECGIWRGGSVMLMTTPGAEDVQAMSGRAAADILQEHERKPADPFWGIAARDIRSSASRSSKAMSRRRCPSALRRPLRCSGSTPTGTRPRATSSNSFTLASFAAAC